MNYTPTMDFAATVLLLVVLVPLAFNLIMSYIFGRKSRNLYRRGGMWGGQ